MTSVLIGLPEFGRRETNLSCGCSRLVIDHGFARYTEISVRRGCSKHSGTRRVGASISPKLRFSILQRDEFSCRYCGRSAPTVALEVDHLVSVAKGGKTQADNLVTACFECNRGKGAS